MMMVDSSVWIDYFNGMKLPDRKCWVFSAGADHSDKPYGMGDIETITETIVELQHHKICMPCRVNICKFRTFCTGQHWQKI
ncbi:hypothetical protein ACTL6P_03840 [Endozoicomonas acroporae]|uniref:hypothetical protein n=1 Tax=Endozoicomonas acroporae TaxID=1701104 RepID=UPI000C75C735